MLESYFFHRHLDDEEQIKMLVQKHWLLGVREIFWPTLIFVASWALLIAIPDKYVFFGVVILSIGAGVWWLRSFFDYYLDAWIITNKGVIDIEWHGWFHRSSSRVLYSDIEGVSYDIHGILPTLLNTGNMSIEKISTGGTVSMQFVKNPKRIEAVILESLEAYMLSKNMKDAKTVQNILAEFVAGSIHTDKVQASKAR